MNDIINNSDIKLLVNHFYKQVQDDKLIGPIFNSKIKAEAWPKHLERMTSFWNTVLFHKTDYRGNPFSHHIHLNISKKHFDRWISLFENSVRNNFNGPKAEEAISRAIKMRLMFESKLQYLSSNDNSFPIM